MNRNKVKTFHHGGGNPPADPWKNLICAIYDKAWEDLERFPAFSRDFESAAKFLLDDPYELFDEAQKAELKEKVEARRKRPLVY